jgi:hypothetical protein
MLVRSPGFSILAILCLTLGIGTNAAALSWIEGILIRPYPLVPHQDRMFALSGTTRGAERGNGLSYPDFVDLEKNSTLFESFIIDRIIGTTLSVGDRAERANLLLARSLLRRHEITMRLALGAGRRRLVKQLFTEGLLLSAIAAAGGIAVAYWCRDALVLAFPTPAAGIVISYPGQIDWRVLALSAGVCIGSKILFALVPAIHASHVDLSGALKSEGSGVVGGSGRSRLRSSLVLVQISLSFVLLAGTALLLQSLQRIQNASPGFSTDVIVSGADLFSAGYNLDRAKVFHSQLLDRVRAIPGRYPDCGRPRIPAH